MGLHVQRDWEDTKMIPTGDSPFNGIYPSTPCPLLPDLSFDETTFAALLRRLADTDGIVGFLVNGHAGENFLFSLDEQRRIVETAGAAVGDRAIIVAGVNCESSLEAARHARDLEASGADVIMVFPPNGWALFQDDETALEHHRRILESTTCPIMLFQGSVSAGRMAYTPGVLERLAALPRVVAIKEGSWEVAAYEQTRRVVKAVAPHVAVMASGDEHLFTGYAIGSEGSLVSLAAVIPEPVVALYRAMQSQDLSAARAQHERIYPLARAIYRAAPGGRANARLKTCLKILERFRSDVMRPPYGATPEAEYAVLRDALRASGALAHAVAAK